jgi:tetratricopeptide (TPR) repeat protein
MAEATGDQPKTVLEEAREFLTQKQPAEAVRILREHLAQGSGTAEEQMLLGVAAAQTRDNVAAITAFEQAIALDPNNPVAHYNLGQIYRQVGRLQEALAACERALQLRPDYPAATSAAAELRRQIQAAPPVVETRPAATPAPASGYGYPAAPGYGGPSSASESYASVSRPVGITILVVLNDIGAVLMIIGGLFLLLGAGAALVGGAGGAGRPGGISPVGAAALGGGLAVLAIVFIVLGVAILAISYFLWKGYSWARWVFMILLALGILSALPGLAGKTAIYSIIGIVMDIVWLVVLNTQAAKEYCTQ